MGRVWGKFQTSTTQREILSFSSPFPGRQTESQNAGETELKGEVSGESEL